MPKSPEHSARERVARLKLADKVLTNARHSDDWLYLDLGVADAYSRAAAGLHFSMDYPKVGLEKWQSMRDGLHRLLCVGRRPRAKFNGLIDGDARELALGVLSVITTKYDLTLGVAVPLAALVLKHGLVRFCAGPAPSPSRARKRGVTTGGKRR